MRGGAKTEDKRMLREKDELTVSVCGEAGERELRSQRVRSALSRECGSRERERWISGDESWKLTI